MYELFWPGISCRIPIHEYMNKDTRLHLTVYAILIALASAEALLLYAIYTMEGF